MNPYFVEIKKIFGFGCMRLPMNGNEVEYQEFSAMTDYFLEQGFNYFDTAHGYLDGKSETAIRDCLVKRHPRDSYILTNKLTGSFFEKEEDIRPFFESQLKACGVDYFDFYLMHAQNAENYKKFKRCNAYETAWKLKEEGKIKHVGLSFHDKASVLEEILIEYPQIEVVQIQFNYVDYEDDGVEGRLCYEVCQKYGKPVIVMEPVKGGSLAILPRKAEQVFKELKDGSAASYALRYAAGFEGIMMVLSGMGDMEQLKDNLSVMKKFSPLSEAELKAVEQVRDIFRNQNLIACTACRYCVAGCPKHIPIPDVFSCMNSHKQFEDWNREDYIQNVHINSGGKASDCIQCGKCEKICPQQLDIRKLLAEAAEIFEQTGRTGKIS